MAKRYGFGYKKIQIDSKVLTPDESVDEFVAFFDHLGSFSLSSRKGAHINDAYNA